MEFLSPMFWFGAALVSIPILLHLVQREQKNRVPFASLMLIPRVPIKQMRRRRLQHLFLLFLRCLGLMLIILAFARPVVTGAWFSHFGPLTNRSVLILIDNSFSMSRPAVWQRALGAARERIRGLGDGDEGMLVQYSEGAEVVTSWEDTREALLQALETRVSPSHAATSYLEALRLAAAQFDEKRHAAREIYWITDLQSTGVASSQGWKVPPEIAVEIEDVGEPASNLFIDEVRVEGQVYAKEYPNPLLVRIEQSPPGPGEGEAQMWIGDQIQARQSFQLDEQGTAQLTLAPFELVEGLTRGRVLVEPDDSLPADNSFHFVVERRRPRPVVIVADGNQSSAFFLQKALATGSNLPFEVEVQRSLPSDLTPESAALVILDDVSRPPPASLLKSFVEAGGGLAINLGRQLRPQAWGGWDDLLPASFGERQYVRSRTKNFTSITEVSWDHPIFSIFLDVHRAALAGVQFYSFWELSPRPEAVVLARFDEGHPALVEATHGRGRVLIFAAAADSSWTDFQLRSTYLPFWDRLLQYAGGWQQRPAWLRVNQMLAAPEAPSEAGQSGSWDLIDPRGNRVLGIEGSAGEPLMLRLPGTYEIRSNKTTDFVAANLQRQESDLSRVRAEDLLALFVPGESQSVGDEGQAAATRQEKQQSLWWLFLVGGAGVLAFESWVANRTRGDESKIPREA